LLVATRVLIQSLLSASNENLNPFARAADLIIMNGETGVPGQLVSEIEQAKIAGVAQVEPLVVLDCGLPRPEGRGDHVRVVGVRIDFQKALKEMGDMRDSTGSSEIGVDIQLDPESRVRIEPR